MTSIEKAEMLKSSIEKLYSKEGRSISYISRLLDINRKTISDKIKEWDLPKAEHRRHVNPSTQKFINANRTFIKSRLDKDIPITVIAEQLGIGRDRLTKIIIENDDVLLKAKKDYIQRMKLNANAWKETRKEDSRMEYIEDLPDEMWKDVLGYEEYQVSNKGRFRKYAKTYDSYYLIKTETNPLSGRLYIHFTINKVHKSFQAHRIVAHAFVEGYDREHNTVNHKDGDVTNNDADNLEWVSHSENNKHAYDVLNRKVVRPSDRRYHFEYILYKGEYQFKTVAAFARFIGKSETQTRRYLDNPEKYDIKLIK